jgi:GntR family transcriptional regulator
MADVRDLQIGAARQALTIGIADIETSGLLGIPLNAPVAHIQRVVMDKDGVVVLVSDGTYRGDVVKLEINLKTPDVDIPGRSAQ